MWDYRPRHRGGVREGGRRKLQPLARGYGGCRAAESEPARRERLPGQIPLQRIGEPEDIVGAAFFPASPESDYVTGTTIYVDGDLLML